MRSLHVDTNVVLRHFLNDIPDHSRAARALFDLAAIGGVELVITETVFTEAECILRKREGYARHRIRNAYERLPDIPNVVFDGSAPIDEVLELFGRTGGLSDADCYLALQGRYSNGAAMVTYDKNFSRVPGLTRLEPDDVFAAQ